MTDYYITNEDIFRAKAERRKVLAKMPFEQKVEALLRLQHMNLEMKKAAGKAHQAARPWDMAEKEYLRYLET